MLEKTLVLLHTLDADRKLHQLPIAVFEQAMEEVQAIRAMPEVVLLVGSSRFKQAFDEVAERLALEGAIVLGKHVFKPGSTWDQPEHVKDLLHAVQFRKVDLANRVYVVNVDGYVGEDTYNVIRYAVRHDKPITFYRETVLPLDSKHSEPVTSHHFLSGVARRIDFEDRAHQG